MTNLPIEWKVFLTEDAVDEFFCLPARLQGRLFALLELLEEVGPFQIPPKRKKHLRSGIWELRVDALEGTVRALYITKSRDIFVVLVFMKKTEKTPQHIIELAEKRIAEV